MIFMNTEPSLWIITSDDDESGSKASFDTGASYRGIEPPSVRNRHQVSAQTLQQNMTEFLSVVESAFEKAEQSQVKMQLEEVELVVEVNGKGQVSLLGTGGELGGKGAITLKFKRKSP
jgi:hypothetical protein